jgi:hypothetical protein
MMNLKVPPGDAVSRIEERIRALDTVQKDPSGLDYYDFIRWCSQTWQVIDSIYGQGDPHSEELRTLALTNCSCNAAMQALLLAEDYHARLRLFVDEIRAGLPEDS